MTMVGILADTHLSSLSSLFQKQCADAFCDCETIIHAGDLTDISILSSFPGKKVHAVHGNSCNVATKIALPESKLISINGYSIGINHGFGTLHPIEDHVLSLFPEAHCIIFGHTHVPVCKRIGTTLLINPGSFQGTGKYGAPGTFALLTLGKDGLRSSIHSIVHAL